MKQELTPEDVMAMGKMWGDTYLSTLPPEERLRGLEPGNIVKVIGLKKLLKGMSVKEIEAYLRKRKKKK